MKRLVFIFLICTSSFSSEFDLKSLFRVSVHPAAYSAPLISQKAIDLTLVYLEDSAWSFKNVLSTLEGAQSVWESCGIALANIELIKIRNLVGHEGIRPEMEHDGGAGGEFDFMRKLLELHPNLKRPIVIFFDDHKKNPNKSEWGAGEARNKNYTKGLVNEDTIWMTHNAFNYYQPADVVLAHEIGHVILNSGHEYTKEDNLMHGYYTKLSPVVTDDQCELALGYERSGR